MMNPQHVPIVIILGKGRSGTTWLGDILNANPGCIYKFEPFLPRKASVFREWLLNLDGRPGHEARQRFVALCAQCQHGIDNPPFVEKDFRSQNRVLLRLLFAIGKRARRLKWMYEWYGGRHMADATHILIKDVNFPNEKLDVLRRTLDPALLYIVRSPFANIASLLKGIELGLFKPPSERDVEKTAQRIEDLGWPELLPYRQRLGDMEPEEFEALRWRVEVEPAVKFAQEHPEGMVVVYEDLCKHPHEVITRVAAHIGWQFSENMRNRIDRTTAGDGAATGISRAYYSVYRNPAESMNKWRKQLTQRQCAAIARVIHDSPLSELWDDLPLDY